MPYYNAGTNSDCQDFEGGTYCGNGAYYGFFPDVGPKHWANRYAGWAFREGIMSGNNGLFSPASSITRQQFSKVMVNGFSLPINTSGGPHYCDVPTTAALYPYVETLWHTGAMMGYAGASCGYSSSYFRPNDDVSRGQVSKVIVVLAENKGWLTINTLGMQDYWDVTPWLYVL